MITYFPKKRARARQKGANVFVCSRLRANQEIKSNGYVIAVMVSDMMIVILK